MPPPLSRTHLEIEPDEQRKTDLSKLRGDAERGFDDNSENRYRSGEREDNDLEEGEEEEDVVTDPSQSYPPPPPRDSLTQPSHSKFLLPQRNASSRRRQPPNFHHTGDNDDEGLNKSNWQR